jgi:hypothetical protein
VESKTPSKPNATERERELEQAVAEAKADVTATTQRALEYQKHIEELKGRLVERATTHPGEFTETGQPKAKTPAAKVAAETKKLIDEDSFEALIIAAKRRAERAEDELRRHRAATSRELLVELEPAAQKAVDDYMAWAHEGEAHYRELVRVASRSTHVITSSRIYGGNTRIVPAYGHEQATLRMAIQPPPLPLPSTFVAEREAEQAEEDE